jgi:hypothetical protein
LYFVQFGCLWVIHTTMTKLSVSLCVFIATSGGDQLSELRLRKPLETIDEQSKKLKGLSWLVKLVEYGNSTAWIKKPVTRNVVEVYCWSNCTERSPDGTRGAIIGEPYTRCKNEVLCSMWAIHVVESPLRIGVTMLKALGECTIKSNCRKRARCFSFKLFSSLITLPKILYSLLFAVGMKKIGYFSFFFRCNFCSLPISPTRRLRLLWETTRMQCSLRFQRGWVRLWRRLRKLCTVYSRTSLQVPPT